MEKHPSDLCDCALCDIREDAIQVVPGVGNPNADIMFIGQNPGANEDKQGKPFVGTSGKWLDRVLKAIDHTREDIFITNAVKCLTPENRLPYSEEIKNCSYWLMKDIKDVNPSIIIPLGACAFQTVTCAPLDIRITDYAGTRIESPLPIFKGKIIFPLLHPASLAYNYTRNYEPYCNHVANLFELLVELNILEPNSEDWREGFKI